MTVIATNTSALRSANASTKANQMLSTAMERLSTGKRINSAKDDAAGLAIASSMTAQIRGMNQGIRNANDGISMAQVAEGALDEVGNLLQRMRELAVQKANGTYSTTEDTGDVANIEKEQNALAKQITSILTNTSFNGTKLFDGSAGTDGTISIQAGAYTDDAIDLELGEDLAADDGIAGVVDTDGAVTDATLEDYDTALQSIASRRASLGATQNSLQSAVNNMTTNVTNLG